MDTYTPIAVVSHEEYTRLLKVEAYMGVLKDYVEDMEKQREHGEHPVVDLKYLKAIVDQCPGPETGNETSETMHDEEGKEEKE